AQLVDAIAGREVRAHGGAADVDERAGDHVEHVDVDQRAGDHVVDVVEHEHVVEHVDVVEHDHLEHDEHHGPLVRVHRPGPTDPGGVPANRRRGPEDLRHRLHE